MLNSLLIGLAGGMRALTPLAAVALAANRGALPGNNGAPAFLRDPIVTIGIVTLAAGELFGDKMRSAPDRIVLAGIAARVVSGAITGMALAPREQRVPAAMLGAIGAIAAAYVTFDARMRAMAQHGQVPTGLVEDAAVIGLSAAIVGNAAGQPSANRAAAYS
ncbi:MAG: hypothetical protein JWR75_1689 [Devosia sp.]|nr:hypothetical protein [Devosia sp.]